ncbi:MAG: hypothetical protein AAFY65_01365 [Pseudomonadota bacterium]
MTITVPRAGTSPGRAANLAQNVVSQAPTFQALQGLGQVAQRVGQQMEQERQSREFQKAQIDLTADINGLRLEAEQIGDPDQLDAFWQGRTDELRKKYLGDDDAPGSISVQNRNRVSNSIDNLTSSVGFNLGLKGVRLRQSQQLANVNQFTFEAEQAAAGAGNEGRAELKQMGAAQIAEAVKSGAMTPAQGQQALLQLNGGVDAATAASLADEPAAVLDMLDNGELTGLSGEAQQQIRQRAQNELAARAANGTKDNIAQLHGYADELVVSDPAEFLQLDGQGMFASIPPRALAALRNKARAAIDTSADVDVEAAAIATLAANPRDYLAQNEDGRWADLDPRTNARNVAKAEAAIAKEEEDLLKDQERAEEERQREIGTQLGSMTDVLRAGRGRAVALDTDFLQRPDVQAHPDYAETVAALDLYSELGQLDLMTEAELAAAVEAERARPITEKYQAERLTVLEGALEQAKGWTVNPLQRAADVGIDVPELDLSDVSADPNALTEQLRARATLSAQLQQDGFVSGDAILTDEDRDQLSELTSVAGSPEDRMVLAEAVLQSGLDPTKVSDDPMFIYAVKALGSDTPVPTVRRILRGQAVIEERNIVMPPQGDRLSNVSEDLRQFFADLPDGEAVMAEVVIAADAIYATRKRISGPVDDIDAGAYAQAVHEALGGRGTVTNPDTATGGLQTVRNRLTILPPGVSPTMASEALSFLTNRQIKTETPRGRTRTTRANQGDDVWRAISTQRDIPTIGGQPLSRAMAESAAIVAVGRDQYQMIWPTASGPITVEGADGQPWTFSLTSLIREARR